MVKTATKPARIQALARASVIIEVIAAAGDEGAGLSEISRATELNKTTAFNLLASLVTLRLIEQDPDSKRYLLGLRNIELGRIAQRRLHIPSLARPTLINLCRATNETVSLAIPDLHDLLVIDSFQGSQLLNATSYAGSRSLYHCTGLGKAVIARWDEAMRQKLYQTQGLPKLTSHTITDIDTLEAQLHQILVQGYSLDIEENELGISCVATSILDGFGEVAAAISVTGPSNRMTKDALEQIVVELCSSADAITAALKSGKRPEYRDAGR